jgi:hypothetical protein
MASTIPASSSPPGQCQPSAADIASRFDGTPKFPVRVTLAELVAMLSGVADLRMGRPMERVLRQTVVAMRLGAAAGMDQAAWQGYLVR